MSRVSILLTAAMIAGGITAAANAESASVLLEKGIYQEDTVGNLQSAMDIYQQIIADQQANRPFVAQAYYRLGMCYLKKKQSPEALQTFKKLLADFPDQKELADKATKKIIEVRQGMSEAEVVKIVGDVVTDISTMADGDSRIPNLLQSLRELNESAVVKELVKYFESDKNTVRRSAIYILWKGGFSDAEPAGPGLLKLCAHEEELTRGMAALALGELKVDGAFEKIADMAVDDKGGFARRCAAYALGLLGKPEGKPILEKVLKDPDALVRNNAEAALTMLAKTAASTSAPQVTKTTPEAFANEVDPGLDKITVTFDRPMMDQSWSFTAGDKAFSDRTGSIFPERTGEISYDATRTTCTMPVKLQPGKVYWVGINSHSFQGFKAADGTPAGHYMILFATKDKDGKPTPLPDDLVKQAREINDRSISMEQDALKAKLINWVEKFFSENYRDITARKTLEWGEPETLPNGNLAIRYKYLATIWDKDKLVIDQRFTFKPDGQYVSAETIEKGPVTRPATVTDKVASEKYSAEGWRLWRQQKHAEAEAAFQKAVAEDSANTNAWNGLGWAQFNQGKRLAAEEAFKKCLEQEPKHAAALNGLGWIERNRNQNDKAIEYWQKSLQASPDATAALNGLAVTYMEMGRYEEAVKYYAMLVEKEPNNKEAKTGLEKAETVLKQVGAAEPVAQEWLKLVDNGEYAKSWDEAAEFFRKALKKEDWVTKVLSARSPLGKVKSRKLLSAVHTTSLPGAPDGQYVVIQFETVFENKKQAVETITPMKDADGKWRVSGYYIK